MNTVFGALLTAAFLVGVAYSLNCRVCESQSVNENCLSPQVCVASAKFCQTEVSTQSGKSITKKCVETCAASGTVSSVTCCATDLCNTSGANGVKVSAMLLTVAVGVSVLLLRAGL